jgi:hypothetical protein
MPSFKWNFKPLNEFVTLGDKAPIPGVSDGQTAFHSSTPSSSNLTSTQSSTPILTPSSASHSSTNKSSTSPTTTDTGNFILLCCKKIGWTSYLNLKILWCTSSSCGLLIQLSDIDQCCNYLSQ